MYKHTIRHHKEIYNDILIQRGRQPLNLKIKDQIEHHDLNRDSADDSLDDDSAANNISSVASSDDTAGSTVSVDFDDSSGYLDDEEDDFQYNSLSSDNDLEVCPSKDPCFIVITQIFFFLVGKKQEGKNMNISFIS